MYTSPVSLLVSLVSECASISQIINSGYEQEKTSISFVSNNLLLLVDSSTFRVSVLV